MISFSALGCTQINGAEQNAATPIATAQPDLAISGNSTPNTDSPNTDSPNTANANTASPSADPELSTAIFAGGCFWCMEQPFDQLPGVVSTTSGYTGGTVENPTYAEVSGGSTGHVEAMEVRYDPQQVSYEKLLTTFWHNIDPLDNRGQFCDQGSQYRSAIFYDTAEQQALAEASKNEIAEQLDQPIATDILPAARFYDAEDYHQDYYQTHAVRYKVYRFGCGRDQRLSDLWGAEAPSH
ncbi:MAG: peptide-methionine (S)-S-oxide reductase MsrA [Phormidesmis sp. RL_2_1]|nr:peptide-methionine (S)-S-oxide reductase MsrA [Phormidesmis sp. RL_2_1]